MIKEEKPPEVDFQNKSSGDSEINIETVYDKSDKENSNREVKEEIKE